MSTVCENTTPLASRFDSSILSLDSGALLKIHSLAETFDIVIYVIINYSNN